MKIATFCLICFLSAGLSAIAQTANQSNEAEKLMQTSRDWARAAAARDTEKALSYWADDAVMISNTHPEIHGKTGIREMVMGGFSDPAFSITWEPRSAQISKDGSMGYLLEDSKVTMKDASGNVTEQKFTSVTIWKKQPDGTWKNVVDVMVSKVPN
jgi:ketosteroid isomerase-like protein